MGDFLVRVIVGAGITVAMAFVLLAVCLALVGAVAGVKVLWRKSGIKIPALATIGNALLIVAFILFAIFMFWATGDSYFAENAGS